MPQRSVATIDAPEFINVTSVSPLISKCEIKVLYTGKNRNGSFITKEVATNMAESLPGCPIVGHYREEKEDFAGHGEQIIIDDNGFQFKDLTKPFGFIAPDTKIWFKKFDDEDGFGNIETREYLMTEGYLWTEQYEECKRIVESPKGNPQSMKLQSESVDGNWAEDTKTGLEFFIINDALFENLCILGEDVEPCFEGADIATPEISKYFSKNEEVFSNTLFTMMNELKEMLKSEGGNTMALENTVTPVAPVATVEAPVVEVTPVIEVTAPVVTATVAPVVVDAVVEPVVETITEGENFSAEEVKLDETLTNETDTIIDGVVKIEDNAQLATDYALVVQELSDLKKDNEALKSDYDLLVAFKNEVENEKKDEMINKFFMLSDEDKAEVITNKETYSLDEIESKLSVICVREKVDFSSDADAGAIATTFNLNSIQDDSPEWIKAVKKTRENLNK